MRARARWRQRERERASSVPWNAKTSDSHCEATTTLSFSFSCLLWQHKWIEGRGEGKKHKTKHRKSITTQKRVSEWVEVTPPRPPPKHLASTKRKKKVSEKKKKKKKYGTKKKTQNSPSLAALSVARTAYTFIIKPTKPNAYSQTRYTFLLSELFPLFQNPLSSVPLSFSVSLCLWVSSLFLLLLLLLLLCPLALISGWWRSNSAHQLS